MDVFPLTADSRSELEYVFRNCDEIRLFYGPVLARCRFGRVPFTIGMFPCGGYIRLEDMDEKSGKYSKIPLFRRLALRLNGCVATALISVLVLGPGAATSSFVKGLMQVFSGAYAPISVGTELVSQFSGIVAQGDLLQALGILASKLLVFNLIANLVPLIGELAGGYPIRDGRFFTVLCIHMLLQCVIWLSWMVGFCLWLFRP